MVKKEYKKKEIAIPTLSAFTYNQSDPEVTAFIEKLKHDLSNNTKK